MRKFVTSVLAAAMIAAPLHAAPWRDQGSQMRPGAFIGAQFTMSFGGQDRPQPRAQLAIAPTQSRISSDGSVRTRVGRGLGFGVTTGDRPTLTLAGVRADTALHPQRGNSADPDKKLGVSDAGWVAIGLGVVVIAGGAYFLYLLKEADKNSD